MSEGDKLNHIAFWAYSDNIFDAALGKTNSGKDTLRITTKDGRTYLYEVTKVATL